MKNLYLIPSRINDLIDGIQELTVMQKEKAKQIVGIILNNTWQSETTLD